VDDVLLDVQDLHVSYGSYEGRLRVLDGLNLMVREGEKVGLVGETGCGKTTTMKSILRILPRPGGRIDSGRILYKGRDLTRMREPEIRRIRGSEITAIFQNPSAALNPVFTVGQQLEDVIRYYGRRRDGRNVSKEAARSRAIKALKDVALPDPERLLSNYPVQLSGGMKQRVCIALALIPECNLLIADEPGTSLDVTIQDQILRLLMTSVGKKETAIIYITHTLGVVREWTDRVYVMYAGSTVETAPTKELFRKPRHPYTQGLLRAMPKLTGGGIARGIPGRVCEYIAPPPGCRFHPRCEHRTERCERERPPLVEVGDEHKVACFRGA